MRFSWGVIMFWRGRSHRAAKIMRGHAVLIVALVVVLLGVAGAAYAQSQRPDAWGAALAGNEIASSPLYAQSLTESNARLESGPAAAAVPQQVSAASAPTPSGGSHGVGHALATVGSYTCSSTCVGSFTCSATCVGNVTCSSTCYGHSTCAGSSTCVGNSTCYGSYTCSSTCVGSYTCSSTCVGSFTCSATCVGNVTCSSTCYGHSTCAGSSTCVGNSTCYGSSTCVGSTTCAGASTCSSTTCGVPIITSPTATSSWPSGSTQTIAWTVNPAKSSGEFRVGLVNAAGTTSYINKQVLPVAGRTIYAAVVAVAAPAGSYKAYVYYRPAVGTGSWTATGLSAAFKVTPINITSPTATSSLPSGSTHNVAWTINPAVSTGEFRVGFVNAAGTTWYATTQVLPTAGKTTYAKALKVTCPAGSYKAYVYYRPTVGTGSWTVTARSAAFSVTPINVTAPTATSSWPSGSTQSVAWTVSPAVSAGEFRVWLVSAAGGWYINKQVLPVAGKTSYTTALKVSCPAAVGYKAYVYWRPTVGTGTWTATAKSAAFTVTPLNITSPTATSKWPSRSTQSVTWTINPAVSAGEFRVWLVSAAGAWYINKQVLAVAAKLSYSTAVSVSCPAAAGYKAYVYWRAAVGTGTWTATAKSAAFTVTP